jgi:AAA+ superfamily predicted ATPase
VAVMLWIEAGRQSYFISLTFARRVLVDYAVQAITIVYDTALATETIRNLSHEALESAEKQLAEVSLTAVIAGREAAQQAEQTED